jgi:hypothetical protein
MEGGGAQQLDTCVNSYSHGRAALQPMTCQVGHPPPPILICERNRFDEVTVFGRDRLLYRVREVHCRVVLKPHRVFPIGPI